MKRSVFGALALSVAVSACASSGGSALSKVAPFPEAEEGFERHVIWLEKAEQESAKKVEVIAGKTIEVDCNNHSFGGALTEQTLSGWGYSYYELKEVNGPMSTMMACPEESKQERFVPVQGEGFLLRYNSKLPVVVYAPEGVEVNYRVWEAGDSLIPAKQQ